MKSRLENIKKDGFAKLISRLDPENYYIDGETSGLRGNFIKSKPDLF